MTSPDDERSSIFSTLVLLPPKPFHKDAILTTKIFILSFFSLIKYIIKSSSPEDTFDQHNRLPLTSVRTWLAKQACSHVMDYISTGGYPALAQKSCNIGLDSGSLGVGWQSLDL